MFKSKQYQIKTFLGSQEVPIDFDIMGDSFLDKAEAETDAKFRKQEIKKAWSEGCVKGGLHDWDYGWLGYKGKFGWYGLYCKKCGFHKYDDTSDPLK